MDQQLVDKLNSEYEVASGALHDFLSKGEINDEELNAILGLRETLIISDFLEKYNLFTEENLRVIESFIVSNLQHEDRLFVSNLIEFATEFELQLPYQECIQFLDKYEEDHTYVQLAVIDYIFENMKWNYLPLLYSPMVNILNNPECNQRVQLKAAFVLFRLTGEQQFLSDIIDLVVNGEGNDEMFKSIMERKYNSEQYFPAAKVLKSLIRDSNETLSK